MPTTKLVEGKKFMWDGVEYKDELEAKAAQEQYQATGFEALAIKEGAQTFVYTRRVVTEVTVEGSPPV
jgi:hypothetical protein